MIGVPVCTTVTRDEGLVLLLDLDLLGCLGGRSAARRFGIDHGIGTGWPALSSTCTDTAAWAVQAQLPPTTGRAARGAWRMFFCISLSLKIREGRATAAAVATAHAAASLYPALYGSLAPCLSGSF
jgi:hypothetical protein